MSGNEGGSKAAPAYTTAVVLRGPGDLAVQEIPLPRIPGPSETVEMRACGVCGSDLRYLNGENPWSLHTLGRNLPSPSNMVLGHEVSGIVRGAEGEKRVAILAYRSCGECPLCQSGRENLCPDTQHLGHGAGWPEMDHFPGGMAERFPVWEGFAHEIPASISFEEATFLDGLAVAVHAVETAGLQGGQSVGIVGLGPIGVLCAQAAAAGGAASVAGCDTAALPVKLAREVGIQAAVRSDPAGFVRSARQTHPGGLDILVDTVGTRETVAADLSLLAPSGTLVLLAVHAGPIPVPMTELSAERRIVTSCNNRYADFPKAVRLMAEGKVRVKPLVTHRFALKEAVAAFALMSEKDRCGAYKIILHP